MFFIIITTSKRIKSVICRRNLFREKKELKEAGDGIYARLARVLKDFRDSERGRGKEKKKDWLE